MRGFVSSTKADSLSRTETVFASCSWAAAVSIITFADTGSNGKNIVHRGDFQARMPIWDFYYLEDVLIFQSVTFNQPYDIILTVSNVYC
jgi:hypothetical protein